MNCVLMQKMRCSITIRDHSLSRSVQLHTKLALLFSIIHKTSALTFFCAIHFSLYMFSVWTKSIWNNGQLQEVKINQINPYSKNGIDWPLWTKVIRQLIVRPISNENTYWLINEYCNQISIIIVRQVRFNWGEKNKKTRVRREMCERRNLHVTKSFLVLKQSVSAHSLQ